MQNYRILPKVLARRYFPGDRFPRMATKTEGGRVRPSAQERASFQSNYCEIGLVDVVCVK